MVTFLIIVSIILAVLAIAQLVRVFEVTSQLRGPVSPLPTDAENKYQSRMMLLVPLVYFGFFLWLVLRYGPYTLPDAASEHGENLDSLMTFNLIIITAVFVITHIYLFYFAFKYAFNKDRKAYYYTHSNKLELLWTIVPAVFLAAIIVYGLSAWVSITDEAPEDSLVIELYPKQFDWTARYSGNDSILGASNYNMISNTNPLGVITKTSIAQMMDELMLEISQLKEELAAGPEGGAKAGELSDRIARRQRQLDRVKSFSNLDIANLESGNDDVLVKSEFYLPKGRNVKFIFRSRDVIHSAYMPHFRAQMNCVPGMTTQFFFKPTKTTEEMRAFVRDDAFDYILLCNKICGAAHYNMQMTIKVVEEDEFNEWLAKQKTFAAAIMPAEESTTSAEGTEVISMIEQ